MFRKITFLVALSCTVSFMGIGALAANDKKQQPQIPPTVVKVVAAQQKTWQQSIQETGSLSAFNGVLLSSEVNGRITKIFFKSGQYVKEGTPLIEIFPDIVKAELDKAKAELEKDKLDYERNIKLFKKGFVDKSTIDKFKAALDSAQADVNDFQAQLSQHLIKAPFDGNIGLRQVSLGDYVSPGQDLVSLQSIDPIRVDFSVPQKYIPSMKVGDMVTLTSQAFTKDYQGKIYAFDANVDSNTRMINVRAKVANPEHKLVPGTFVEVNINITHPQPVIMIPQTAVVYSMGANYVFLMQGGKAIQTPIELGSIIKDGMVIVTKGLKAGDQVITEGQMKLFNGFPVVTEQQYQQYIATQMQANTKKK